MPSKKIKTPLRVDRYFHIYNRGNNKEKIFEKAEDYLHFMDLYLQIVQPYVNTYAYCFLPNHFHFLIKVDPEKAKSLDCLPSHLFRKFFQAYSIWFNKEKNRRGSLFTKYYRRIEITDDNYLKHVISYIHRNPVKHGISNNFGSYPFSSFKFYKDFNITWVSREETLAWFDKDLVYFLEFHHLFIEIPEIEGFIIDEI